MTKLKAPRNPRNLSPVEKRDLALRTLQVNQNTIIDNQKDFQKKFNALVARFNEVLIRLDELQSVVGDQDQEE